MARQFGVTSYLINGPDEIKPEWLSSFNRIGISSGASTPEELVQRVIEAIAPDKVTVLEGVEEDITFVLPKEIR